MMLNKLLLSSMVLALMVGCTATQQVPTVRDPAVVAAEQQAAKQAELEAQQKAEVLAKQKAEADARAEAARIAEISAKATEAAAVLEQQQKAQRAQRNKNSAPSTEVVQPKAKDTNTEKRAAAVAKQQARIAELRAKIAENKSETSKLDSANASLKEAITAAEALTATLTAEQQKYATTNPQTGSTAEPLAKSKIDELSAEVERLRVQAEALAKQKP